MEELEADFSWLGKQKMDTLEDLGVYINDATPKEYCISYKDKYGRDRERVICPVNAPIGTLEWYILKEMGKQVDLVDLTQHRSHDQIIQLLDTHSETWADIDSYDFPAATRKEAPFDSMQDAFTEIQAHPREYLEHLGEPNLPVAIASLPANANSITYTPTAPPWAAPKKVFIHDIIIKLFQNKMVYNKEIAQYLYGRVSLERRKERTKARQERTAAKTGTTTNTPAVGGIWSNTISETNEELSIPQLYSACEQAQKKPNAWSAYSFDKKWFFVRYQTAPMPAHWIVQYQKKDGTTSTINEPSIGQVVAQISTLAEKKESKEKQSLSVDMWENFSRTEFTKLCEAIHDQKKRWDYKLGGKSYFVEERPDTTATPPVSFDPPQFIVNYPGNNGVATTENHLHISDTRRAENPTIQNLIEYLEWDHGIYDPKHDLDREHLLGRMQGLKNWWIGKEKITYTINGHTYHMWSKNTTWLWVKRKYYAEVPVGEHGKEVVTAFTVEGLYNKIIDKVQWKHSEKPAEWSAKAEWSEPKDAAHAAEAHPAWEGTFYDRSVEKLFGHWLIGRGLTGFKNLFPKPVRGILWSTVNAGVKAGAVGFGIYGTSLYLGSAVLASTVNPAMLLVGGYVLASRLWKWNKKRKEGGGDTHAPAAL